MLIGAHKMGLAGQERPVPTTFETVNERRDVRSERCAVIIHIDVRGISPAEGRRPRRAAHGAVAVETVKPDTIRGQSIYVGGKTWLVPIAANDVSCHLVTHDENNIGFFLFHATPLLLMI